jgi:hypothetical protein
MNKIKTKVVGRITAATAISMALAASAVSVASASEHGSRLSSHDGFAKKANWSNATDGVVTAVSAASVTITAHDGTSTPYAITTATTFTEGSTPVTAADLVVGSHVDIQVSSTTPVTAASINIKANRPIRLGGIVTAVTATSVTVTGRDGTSTPYAITLTTTFTEGSATVMAAALVVGDHVDIQVSSAATTTASAIEIALARVSGKVTAVSGDDITVTDHQGNTSTIVVSATTTYTKGATVAALTDVTVGTFVSAQGMLGVTPTTLGATSVSIGSNCRSSGGGHFATGHLGLDSRNFGGGQGGQNQGFGGRGSHSHGNFRR